MGKLEGKIAVITGGNSGIGLASAQLFQQEGATVIVTARNEKRLAESKAVVGEGIEIVQADVTQIDQLQHLFEYVGNKYGQIDILFANAGIAFFAPLEMVEENFLDNMFNVNFKGAYFSVQKALPWLREGSTVIFNTSIVNVKGMPNTSVYAATKAALRSLTRTLAGELTARGIRVNAVSPGPIATPIYDKMGMPKEDLDGFSQQILSSVPLQRFGSSEELAKAALFLASDDSSFVVGAELAVDGGMTQV